MSIYEVNVIATDAYDNQFDYCYAIEDTREFCHFVARIHSQYQHLVADKRCKVYSILCFEEVQS